MPGTGNIGSPRLPFTPSLRVEPSDGGAGPFAVSPKRNPGGPLRHPQGRGGHGCPWRSAGGWLRFAEFGESASIRRIRKALADLDGHAVAEVGHLLGDQQGLADGDELVLLGDDE